MRSAEGARGGGRHLTPCLWSIRVAQCRFKKASGLPGGFVDDIKHEN